MKIILYIFIFSFFNLFPFSNTVAEDGATADNTMLESPPSPPDCAGENGVLRMFYYNEINGFNITDLELHPHYPSSPSGMTFLDEFNFWRFNNYYGAVVRGYLLAPETGEYAFQIDGDNQSKFELSTDDSPDNLANGIYVIDPNIPDSTVNLTEGNYYYFEYKHKNYGGYDASIFNWKLPSNTDGEWTTVDINATYDYTCETICNLPGTPCDDGDPNTIDDQEDGHCNCFGRIETTNSCIGARGEFTALYYDGISGTGITDLLNAADFPANPARTDKMTFYKGPVTTGQGTYGSLLKNYIYIPVTGEYTFNLISDNGAKVWLSSSDSDEDEDLIELCYMPQSAWDITNHNRYATQTSETLTLQGGQYYYMELIHKENGGSDYFIMHWKTPFLPDTDWTIISKSYLYRYGCESEACVPQGAACNDQNDNTFNDQYDDNCNCVGTPCITDDCDNNSTFHSYNMCDVTDQHTNQLDAWQSCETTPSPNPARGNKHWIMYDLATLYQIHDTHIWNYNMTSETGKGIKDVAIDISMDGTTWTELGTGTWPQAPGTVDYEGFAGADYGGAIGQYILITALNTWNGEDCAGFSELKVTMETCPNANTPCDDGNAMTENDAYDEFCNCAGSPVTLATDLLSFGAKWDNKNVLVEWVVENEELGTLYEVQRSLDAQNFEAIGLVTSKGLNGQKMGYQFVDTRAHQLANELFYRLRMIESSTQERFSHVVSLRQANGLSRLKMDALQPNPFRDLIQIDFTVPTASPSLSLLVFNGRGQLIRRLTSGAYTQGRYSMQWDGRDDGGSNVEAGIYYLQLTDGKQRIGRRVVKL